MDGLGIYVIRRITQRPFLTTTSRVCAIPIGQPTEVAPACGKRLVLALPQWVRNIITKFSPSLSVPLQLIRLVGTVDFLSSVRGAISGEPRMLTHYSLRNWFISLLGRCAPDVRGQFLNTESGGESGLSMEHESKFYV